MDYHAFPIYHASSFFCISSFSSVKRHRDSLLLACVSRTQSHYVLAIPSDIPLFCSRAAHFSCPALAVGDEMEMGIDQVDDDDGYSGFLVEAVFSDTTTFARPRIELEAQYLPPLLSGV